ncbi:hypothetical protein RKE30_21225 [Streptomyces sp. Li-HN-5-11]|uniref:hypothetical protein n=1 Tax=Streptomyces sp. Li-HN-5-11 TaxID=3075432 RepID=UPI0028AE2396|nr:hypothetical protein [Streptomyces sp. Li-HN-5-11]WNM32724.1 hypothetical protein RKE30_21090 [Streptomyces sp. Li-HN-5-11]WNM32746.1 hypothetical protein RKE30_21225 [Streptomyces sp. Li-HN-5-11]WOP38529.1 hypothetical protein RKE32_34485 [Streptomyces sp. Li-HN-5-13]
MDPEHCPFHHRPDTCLAVARRLAQAGLLDPAPHAPAARAAAADDVAPVPARQVTLPLIAQHINTWGRVVIDPTLPHAEPTALDERSLRYTLQALWEAASDATRRRVAFPDGSARGWWRLSDALQEAQSAARRTTAADDSDGSEADLWWYIALLHLGHARAQWKDRVGHTPPH